MKFFDVKTSIDVEKILEQVASNYDLKSENVSIADAVGRVLAQDITVETNVPEFDRSTVDGYAIKSENSIGASQTNPIVLKVVGTVLMGKIFQEEIGQMEAVYVPTGGMIPKGANTMIMVEDTELLEGKVNIYKTLEQGSSIVYKGEDLSFGSVALSKFRKLKTNDIGVLAALGICEICVLKKPTITIISTGDEIVDIGEPMNVGQVRDINRYVLVAMVNEMGGIVNNHCIIKDDYDKLLQGIKDGVKSSDLVFLSGGSSVGTRDFTYDVLKNLGEVLIHGVSIKPGKPTIVGLIDNKMVVGLPGHPMSSIVIFKIFFEKFIFNLLKQDVEISHQKAILENNVRSAPGRETYQMVELIGSIAKPIYSKSGFISTLSKADGYFVIPKDVEGANKGEEVDVICLVGKFGGLVG